MTTMKILRPICGLLLALAALLFPALSPGQDQKAVKDDKPASKDSKEQVFKGTLTGLTQEVAHVVPLMKDQAYTVSAESRGFFTEIRIDDGKDKKTLIVVAGSKTFKSPGDGVFRFLVSSPGGS